MLTSRGWWFLLAVLALLALGLLVPPRGHPTLTIIALTLLLWFLWEWFWFAVRARVIVRRLFVERELRNEHGPVETVWARQTVDVRARLHVQGNLSLPYVIVTDRVPFGCEQIGGETFQDGAIRPEQPLELNYRLRCPAAGKVRFEGLGVKLADLQGFFYHQTFVADVAIYRVLPPLVDTRGQVASSKRYNLLPPPGVHRHRRPGSGSELLDLRDYLPGDPPKMIAWKVSARRDRLITKEFESDVPVRCTLFVDRSNSVRLGPPEQKPLTRLIEIAATVTQANAGIRDLTGLCLFDEQGVTYVRPARGPRHVSHLLNLLTDAAGLAPTSSRAPVETLLPLAHAFADEVYPHLMRRDINPVPFWLPWLWPVPTYPQRRRSYLHREIIPETASSLLALMSLAFVVPLFLAVYLAYGLLAALLVLLSLTVISWKYLDLAYHAAPLLFSPQRRREARWRKRLAALFSVRYGLAPGGLALLLEDDERFGVLLQRFLAEHQVPYSLPLYDRRGHYLFASPSKVDVLARSLMRAAGKGHDNELFVLLADLVELGEQLGPLLRAVKVAVARHHRVIVICPWPAGMALPEDGRTKKRKETDEPVSSLPAPGLPIAEAVRRATAFRFHRAYHHLRRTFARLSVPVVCAAGGDPARLILDRLEQLRTVGGRR